MKAPAPLPNALLGFLLAALVPAQPVYIVHDDPAPMQALAAGYRQHGLNVRLEDQRVFRGTAESRPAQAIVMYVHGTLDPEVERRLIGYAERGGRLIVLHHGAASGKVAATRWLPFLGLEILPRGAPEHAWDVLRGECRLVNLNPSHYVTSHGVVYDRRIRYTPSDSPSSAQQLPAIVLPATEIFLNQLFTDGRRKTVLLGLNTTIGGKQYTQDRGGWLLPAGEGHVFYFQAGHQASDFEHPGYARILLNAVLWRPGSAVRSPIVAVDAFHNDEKETHYRWEGTDPGGFSSLAALLAGMGARTRSLRQRLTTQYLAGVDCLILAAPDTPAESGAPRYITNLEVQSLAAWVRNGGTLVLLGNNRGNAGFVHLNRLARRFGIRFAERTVGGAAADGRLKFDVAPSSPVFPRGGAFYAEDVVPLEIAGTARPLLQHNGEVIMAIAQFGRGTVFALGDPWIYNKYIDTEDNWLLASELFRYLLFESELRRSVWP
ncbi:MAG TPA: DUF4350 domain-containing protein [Bryobacteraceae bacterium]|nr:DUF4350 domain-containing protein [Bryobacteraceae bacterium]